MSLTAISGRIPPTALALATISLWSFLAYLGVRLAHLPPFLLVGIALTIAGMASASRARSWRVPASTFAVGVAGIFGYHFLLFSALRSAPAVEANLINYLWPLLLVLLSPLYLPGYRLHRHHVLGALIGFAGAALVVTGGRVQLDLANLPGYVYAAAAAVTWASYSLLTKRLPPFPTGAVGGFCLTAGLLSLGLHLLLEPRTMPAGTDWIFLVLLGVGPMGAAFFLWDAALKAGDPRIIGALAYLTPLLSTMVLVIIGGGVLTWSSGVAMVLIVAGASIGALDLLRPASPLPGP